MIIIEMMQYSYLRCFAGLVGYYGAHNRNGAARDGCGKSTVFKMGVSTVVSLFI
jgi:hypothetical protein